MAKVEGQKVKVGDWIGFKSDVEQSGVITEVQTRLGRTVFVVENKCGFDGGYIGGQTVAWVDVDDCWLI